MGGKPAFQPAGVNGIACTAGVIRQRQEQRFRGAQAVDPRLAQGAHSRVTAASRVSAWTTSLARSES